jgi:hypothetical protein
MTAEEHHALEGIAQRLAAQFPSVPNAEVHDLILRMHGRFATARIRSYVPLLVENLARNALFAQTDAPQSA